MPEKYLVNGDDFRCPLATFSDTDLLFFSFQNKIFQNQVPQSVNLKQELDSSSAFSTFKNFFYLTHPIYFCAFDVRRALNLRNIFNKLQIVNTL